MSVCFSVYGTGVESHNELVFGATGACEGRHRYPTYAYGGRETHAHRHFRKGFYF